MSTDEKLLTVNERKVLLFFKDGKEIAEVSEIAEGTRMKEDAVRQAVFSLDERGILRVQEQKKVYHRLTEEGKAYAEKGLPERRIYDLLLSKGGMTIEDVISSFGEKEAKIGIGWLRKKGWASIEEGKLVPHRGKEGEDQRTVEEVILEIIHQKGEMEMEMLTDEVERKLHTGKKEIKRHIAELTRRELLDHHGRTEIKAEITEEGRKLLDEGISLEEEISQLTTAIIKSGKWKEKKIRHYDVRKPSRTIFPAKIHPYQRILDRIRRIFVEMGFKEIKGRIIQSSFWNFDALFVPQDHPARDMQDTFYLPLKGKIPAERQLIQKVKEMQEHGGDIASTGWDYTWREDLAERYLLRTHTTAVTINYLAYHKDPPVKVFCLDKVFRREAIDQTHIPEFDQLEGIIMEENASFEMLLGTLSTFFRKMGFHEVRFRPGYFPYTEPSLESEVYVEGIGWVELGGAGIFREEVTAPIGVNHPVLAWGLGVGRLAMLLLRLNDIRKIYQVDLKWLRETPYLLCQRISKR